MNKSDERQTDLDCKKKFFSSLAPTFLWNFSHYIPCASRALQFLNPWFFLLLLKLSVKEATGKKNVMAAAPALSHLIRWFLWTDVLRAQSSHWSYFKGEIKAFIHWFILLSRTAASCSPRLLLGSQTGERVIPSLCVSTLKRVGCMIWRRHYKWPLFLSALVLIVPLKKNVQSKR